MLHLYHDRSNFGPRPIRLVWFALVLPSLLLNYLGQGAVLHDYGVRKRHGLFWPRRRRRTERGQDCRSVLEAP